METRPFDRGNRVTEAVALSLLLLAVARGLAQAQGRL